MNKIELITSENCAPCEVVKPKIASFAAARGIAFEAKNYQLYPPGFLSDNQIVSTPTVLLLIDGVLVRIVEGGAIQSALRDGAIIDQTFGTTPEEPGDVVPPEESKGGGLISALLMFSLVYVVGKKLING